jgi:hypothetical protein
VDTFFTEIDERMLTTYRFSVTAPDPMFSSEYDVRVIVAFNDNCLLQSLNVRGNLIEGFHPDTTNYTIVYPIGTDSTELATIEDIQAIAEDANATVEIKANGINFTILVNAQDGEHARVYTIEQVILLSNNTLLSGIYLDSVLIRDFNPEQLEYTYYIVDAQPSIHAIAEDPEAEIEYSMYALNEPFYIYVTAPDGTEDVYTIKFLSTTIEASKSPRVSDVLVKHIPGTHDFVFATLRKNVSVAVYTLEGQLLFESALQETTQNEAVIGINADGSERLLDVHVHKNVYTVPGSTGIYLYIFWENGKQRITSGKMTICM